jgi:hypothetical protein
MRLTGTGKRRISTAVLGHEAKEEEALALALVQVVERERGPDRVVAELAHVRAEAALERDPVAEGPEHGRVAAELELDQVVAGLVLVPVAALAPRTKLVTAAHRHGLVPVPKRVEDLAAAAETTRDPAATEAATAWVAAGTAVAVAPDIAVAVAAVVVAPE